ncbi:hypothetical protein [Herbaspirillum huttiense]|uniref:hypothetical protein n=1 Tax=Herbaspirillum huttiense TaxID=863372 RepID=UPI0039B107B4
MARLPSFTALLLAAALFLPSTTVPAQSTTPPSRQALTIGAVPYAMAVFANADLGQLPSHVVRAVIIVHGVKRNADAYFALGEDLLQRAQLTPGNTLLLAPNFMAHKDPGILPGMPVWGGDAWMQGEASIRGVKGVTSFAAMDDLLRWLADPRRFPDLREIVLIGHSAGAQLMQRHALMSPVPEILQQAGLHLRYVLSSPSSYLYLSPERPQGAGLAIPATGACAGYDDYRYGLGQAPDYLARQHLDARQLFVRYAGRDVRYLVGGRDVDPAHRYLDRSCAAALQGPTRLARQLAYLDDEQFLAKRWQVQVQHPQQVIPDAAHGASRLYRSPLALAMIFPALAQNRAGPCQITGSAAAETAQCPQSKPENEK